MRVFGESISSMLPRNSMVNETPSSYEDRSGVPPQYLPCCKAGIPSPVLPSRSGYLSDAAPCEVVWHLFWPGAVWLSYCCWCWCWCSCRCCCCCLQAVLSSHRPQTSFSEASGRCTPCSVKTFAPHPSLASLHCPSQAAPSRRVQVCSSPARAGL